MIVSFTDSEGNYVYILDPRARPCRETGARLRCDRVFGSRMSARRDGGRFLGGKQVGVGGVEADAVVAPLAQLGVDSARGSRWGGRGPRSACGAAAGRGGRGRRRGGARLRGRRCAGWAPMTSASAKVVAAARSARAGSERVTPGCRWSCQGWLSPAPFADGPPDPLALRASAGARTARGAVRRRRGRRSRRSSPGARRRCARRRPCGGRRGCGGGARGSSPSRRSSAAAAACSSPASSTVALPQQRRQRRARGAEDRRVAGGQLEDAARAHRRRVDDRVGVEEDAVGLVDVEDALVGQFAEHVGGEALGEAEGPVLAAEAAVVDHQAARAGGVEQRRQRAGGGRGGGRGTRRRRSRARRCARGPRRPGCGCAAGRRRAAG